MKHTAHVLNNDGDIILTWDPNSREDRENMKKIFATFMKQGFEAYAVSDGSSKLDAMFGPNAKGEKILKLNDAIGKLIMRKKVIIAPSYVSGGYPNTGMNQGRL